MGMGVCTGIGGVVGSRNTTGTVKQARPFTALTNTANTSRKSGKAEVRHAANAYTWHTRTDARHPNIHLNVRHPLCPSICQSCQSYNSCHPLF